MPQNNKHGQIKNTVTGYFLRDRCEPRTNSLLKNDIDPEYEDPDFNISPKIKLAGLEKRIT